MSLPPVKRQRDPADSPLVTPLPTPSVSASCPRCGAGVRAGSDWCTLCFADVRPVPPPRVTQQVAGQQCGAPPAIPVGATLTAAAVPQPAAAAHAVADGDAQLPCPTCAAPVLLSVAVCHSCGAGLFDQLRGDAATVKVPMFGDLMAMSKGARTALAFGFAVFVVAVLFVLVELLGKL